MLKNSLVKKTFFVSGIILLSLLFNIVFSCSDDLGLIDKNSLFTIESISIENGDWIVRATENLNSTSTILRAAYIFFRIKGSEEKPTNSLILKIELYNRDGDLVSSFEKTSPTINTDVPIEIPEEIKPDFYKLILTLFNDKKLMTKVSREFFLLEESLTLNGIYSFPAFAYPEKPVLLIADLKIGLNTNPYLRWLYKKEVIAEGLYADGYNQIFWEAPIKEGVYTLELEVYPYPILSSSLVNFKKIFKGETEIFLVPKPTKILNNSSLTFSSDLFQIYFETLKKKDKLLKQNQSLKTVQALPRIVGDSLTLKINGEAIFYSSQKLFLANKKISSFNLDLEFIIENYIDLINKKVFKLIFTEEPLELNLFFNAKGELSLFLELEKEGYLFSSGQSGFGKELNYAVSLKISKIEKKIEVDWLISGEQLESHENYSDFTNAREKFNLAQGQVNGLSFVLKNLNLSIPK